MDILLFILISFFIVCSIFLFISLFAFLAKSNFTRRVKYNRFIENSDTLVMRGMSKDLYNGKAKRQQRPV